MISSDQYSLTISGFSNLQQGVYHAATLKDNIALVFYKNDKEIIRTNLAADRTSLYKSIEATEKKIALFCQRLKIDKTQISYDRSNLSKLKNLSYKLLFLKKIFFEAFIPVQWCIVYKKTNDKKWRKIIPDSNVFQADPFLVYKDNKYYIFYEELKFEDYHGYLRAAELDVENGKLINDKIILKLENHLSFPNVFEENDTFYMIPECADSKRVDLFECTEFPYVWKNKQTLIDNIHAVDTTPLKTDKGWYLFTSEIVDGADCDDELSIYQSADIFNQPFIKLYDQPVISDVTNARMAGHFIRNDGEIIRVSQNCGKRYGHQANFNKILQLEGGYEEELIESIKPSQGAVGFHTYNQAHEIIVGDMEIPRFDIYSLNRFIGANFRRLFKIILRK